MHDADIRMGQNYSLRAAVTIGALAEELGFPTVAERYFAWASTLGEFCHDEDGVLAIVSSPVDAAQSPRLAPPDVLGFLQFLAGSLDDARASFAFAAEADPGDAGVALHLARTQILLGEPAGDVVRTLEKVAAVTSSRQTEVMKELACALLRAGDPRADDIARNATAAERDGMPEALAEFQRASRERWKRKLASTDDYVDRDSLRFMWRLTHAALTFLGEHEDHVSFAHRLTHRRILETLSAHPSIKTIVEFGVFCGKDAFEMAQRFPHITYIGIDRSPYTKEDNDAHFQLPNLRYEAAEVTDFLSSHNVPAETLFVHSRTAALLYPAAVEELYTTLARVGIRHVLGIEEFGIDRATGAFTRFGAEGPHSSTLRPPSCYAHDYAHYAASAGYHVDREALIPIATLWKMPKLTDAHEVVLHGTLIAR